MSKLSRRLLFCSIALAASSGFISLAKADDPNDPPSVTITSPEDGVTFQGAPVTLDVTLDVYAGNLGLDRVELRVDGATVGTLTEQPWTLTGVTLDEGMHSLVAVAFDASENEHPSETVTVAVLASEETGEETGDDASGDSNDDGGKGGCAVTSGTSVGGSIILAGFMMFGLAGMRRRS